jgi:death-on-curing protein
MSRFDENIDPKQFRDYVTTLNLLAGEKGIVIDQNKLLSAISSISYYSTPKDKIASVVRSLIKNHAFLDGNKRTAALFFVSMANIMGENINLTIDQLDQMFVKIAKNNYSVEEISKLIFTNGTDTSQLREWMNLINKHRE